ncbi:MAG: hypothetical protein ACI3XL_03690 [Eubacteriales bacterium]
MFKVNVIQNISEIRNYSYADIRQNLRDMHFEVNSYTHENIEHFLPSLKQDDIDCVIFASNSMNDKKIHEYVSSPEFCECFDAYLNDGGACLVLHQNSLKNTENPLPFITDGSVISLKGCYADESVSFASPSETAMEYFSFPNHVSLDEITRTCDSSSLSGKYWQFMEPAEDTWSPILCDAEQNGVILRHNEKKIIFSSLLLDYQKHLSLLQNLLINMLAGNRGLAILEDNSTNTLGFNYFLNSLEGKKLYYKKYTNNEIGRKELLENTRMGLHSSILLKEGTLRSLPDEIIKTIDNYGVKLIEITDHELDKADTFVIHSIDKNLSLQFAHLEFAVQEELTHGFISDSFMKTVDVLMLMKEFESNGLTKGHYDKDSISAVLRCIEPHIQTADGSYDETFGATCKALWLFLHFLGKEDKLTKNAYEYIKSKNSVSTIREFLERHYILSYFEADRSRYLKNTCEDTVNSIIEKRFGNISEYDFLTVFKVAIAIGNENQLMNLFSYIQANTTEDGKFFSSYVTSVITSYLIDIHDTVIKTEENKERLRRLLFDLVMYIRNVNTEDMPLEDVLRIVCTLYKFETVVSFPIGDLTEIIFKTDSFPHEYKKVERKITKYQDARIEMDAVKDENAKLKKENKELKRANRLMPVWKGLSWACLTLFALSVYICVYLGFILLDSEIPVIATLFEKIKDSWVSLFSLAIVPLITYGINKYINKKKENDD